MAARTTNINISFFFQAEDGIRDYKVTGVQTCALPISESDRDGPGDEEEGGRDVEGAGDRTMKATLREGQTFAGESLLVRYVNFVKLPHTVFALPFALDRKSTRLNSSHLVISYAVFCLKKKKKRRQ